MKETREVTEDGGDLGDGQEWRIVWEVTGNEGEDPRGDQDGGEDPEGD